MPLHASMADRAFVSSATGFGIPHQRKRCFILASLYSDARDVLLQVIVRRPSQALAASHQYCQSAPSICVVTRLPAVFYSHVSCRGLPYAKGHARVSLQADPATCAGAGSTRTSCTMLLRIPLRWTSAVHSKTFYTALYSLNYRHTCMCTHEGRLTAEPWEPCAGQDQLLT